MTAVLCRCRSARDSRCQRLTAIEDICMTAKTAKRNRDSANRFKNSAPARGNLIIERHIAVIVLTLHSILATVNVELR